MTTESKDTKLLGDNQFVCASCNNIKNFSDRVPNMNICWTCYENKHNKIDRKLEKLNDDY